jgi:hypothetical protein
LCILQLLYILYILVLNDNIFICVKFSVFLLLIMIKNHRNINHLNSLIFGSIENDRVDDLRYYISVYPSDKIENIKKSRDFLISALTKCKPESSKFLYKEGFNTTTPLFIILETPIDKMSDVYDLMKNIGINTTFNKRTLIKRILEPYKVLDNPNRIDVAMKYLEQGFFSEEDFEETLNEISSSHEKTRFKYVVNQYVREYKLNKIL